MYPTDDVKVGLRIAWLVASQHSQLEELARESSLESLSDDERRRHLLDRGMVLGAYLHGQLVGCTCLEAKSRRGYMDASGNVVQLPTNNLYLCGTFVLEESRGRGVGLALYRARLGACSDYDPSVVGVEILGTGTPLSVDALAATGYRFHRSAGFQVVGHSLEDDHGPFLARMGSPTGRGRELPR